MKALVFFAFCFFSLSGWAADRCQSLFTPSQNPAHQEKLKLAAVSFPMQEGLTWTQFTRKVKDYVDAAQAGGAQLVVFPELLTLDLIHETGDGLFEKKLTALAETRTPKYFKFISELAVKKNLYILGGTSPRKTPDGIYNTAILAYPNGKTFYQDKIFMTPFETEWGWLGGRKLNLVDTPWGKTSILICYDCEFPILSHLLVSERPDLILIPSMTSDLSGKNRVAWSAQARAVEHFAYVVVTGITQASSEPFVGQAAVITPQGRGLPTSTKTSQLNQPGLIFEELSMKALADFRKNPDAYPALDQSVRQKKEIGISNQK